MLLLLAVVVQIWLIDEVLVVQFLCKCVFLILNYHLLSKSGVMRCFLSGVGELVSPSLAAVVLMRARVFFSFSSEILHYYDNEIIFVKQQRRR